MHLLKKITTIFVMSFSLMLPGLAYSHGDHAEPLNDQQAIERAIAYTGRIIDRPEGVNKVKLDENWRTVTDAKIHKKTLRYFIVALNNANRDETLYLLISTSGQLHDANFNGNFAEL